MHQPARFLLCFSLLILYASWLTAQDLPNVDATYDAKIMTVLLFPQLSQQADDPAQTLNPPVLDSEASTNLTLEFDDLTANYRNFRARILHCNADWTVSALNDIEFTYEYNDNPITDYQISSNTKIPYYHYRFMVPRLKLPGNYLLVVYDERDKRKIMLTRRFSTYARKVAVAAFPRFSTDPARQFTVQQVDLSISYKNYPVISPQDDFMVIIRQNYRDDRVIIGLKPTAVREFDGLLEYKPFNGENAFPGGNDFRFFDLRSLTSRGNFLERVVRQVDHNLAYVQTDLPRSRSPYFQTDDFNGQYVIDQRDFGTGNGATFSDYVETIFTLKTEELSSGELYVNGGFNNWLRNDRNRMAYDASTGQYRANILLKQGVYNYNYALLTTPPGGLDEIAFEGSYSATENVYEVFVYNRPPASRADQLIGYARVSCNQRK